MVGLLGCLYLAVAVAAIGSMGNRSDAHVADGGLLGYLCTTVIVPDTGSALWLMGDGSDSSVGGSALISEHKCGCHSRRVSCTPAVPCG